MLGAQTLEYRSIRREMRSEISPTKKEWKHLLHVIELTLPHVERPVSLVDAPEPEAGGLRRLRHLHLQLAAGRVALLEDEAAVALLVSVDVGGVHGRNQVPGKRGQSVIPMKRS